MSRIDGVDSNEVDRYAARIFKLQTEKWGAPLANHLVYARRPTVLRGVRGMWTGLDQSGLIDAPLLALVNRRVASLNECEF